MKCRSPVIIAHVQRIQSQSTCRCGIADGIVQFSCLHLGRQLTNHLLLQLLQFCNNNDSSTFTPPPRLPLHTLPAAVVVRSQSSSLSQPCVDTRLQQQIYRDMSAQSCCNMEWGLARRGPQGIHGPNLSVEIWPNFQQHRAHTTTSVLILSTHGHTRPPDTTTIT